MDTFEERNSLLDCGRTFFCEETDTSRTAEEITFEGEEKGFEVGDERGRERTKEVVLGEDVLGEGERGILH